MFETPRTSRDNIQLTPEREALILRTVFEREMRDYGSDRKYCLSLRDKDVPAAVLQQFDSSKATTRSHCSNASPDMEWRELFSKKPVSVLNITEIKPVSGQSDHYEVTVDYLVGATAQERGKKYVLSCGTSGACEVLQVFGPRGAA